MTFFVSEAGLGPLSALRLAPKTVYRWLDFATSVPCALIGPGGWPFGIGGGADERACSGLDGVKTRGGPYWRGGWEAKGESFQR